MSRKGFKNKKGQSQKNFVLLQLQICFEFVRNADKFD